MIDFDKKDVEETSRSRFLYFTFPLLIIMSILFLCIILNTFVFTDGNNVDIMAPVENNDSTDYVEDSEIIASEKN